MTKSPSTEKSASSENVAFNNLLTFQASIFDEIEDLKQTIAGLITSTSEKFDQLPKGQFADTELIIKSLMSQIRHKNNYATPLDPKVRSEISSSKIHGHLMMVDLIISDFLNRPELSFNTREILEIGTMRENIWNQSSTSRLGCLARLLDTILISVDMDPNNAIQAKKTCAPYSGFIKFITAQGELFLTGLEGTCPTYVYLDAYDFDHPNHSEHRQSRYEKLLGERVNDEACWKMHLDCAKSLSK